MPTPYTEGNGCKYCNVAKSLVAGKPTSEVKKTLQCMCQGPELEDCPYPGVQMAMYCKHFKPESEEFYIYLKQLRESAIINATFHDHDPLGKVDQITESENGVAFDIKLNKPVDDIFKNDKDDIVNHPSHYTAGGIECIDAIKAALECHEDPIGAWLTGQCIKYLWRWPLKNGLEDLKKCRFYLDKLIEKVEEK